MAGNGGNRYGKSLVILATATFFEQGIVVDDLTVAAATLSPILGPAASTIFAAALVACLLVEDPFSGLVWSQAPLSLQLPLKATLLAIGVIVTALDVALLAGV